MRLAIVLSVVLVSGCAGLLNKQDNRCFKGEIDLLPTDLKPGTTMAEIQDKFAIYSKQHVFTMPNATGSTLIAMDCRATKRRSHFWMIFEDGKLASIGKGDSRDAEYSYFQAYYDYQHRTGILSTAEAERGKYQKRKALYSMTPYDDDYFAHRVVVAGKLDRKEIDNDMANSMIAQKRAELQERIDTAIHRSNQLSLQHATLELQRSSLLMQTMREFGQATQIRQSGTPQNYEVKLKMDCRTTSFGSSWYTHCW